MTKDEINKLIEDNINIAYKIVWEFNNKLKGLIEYEELVSIALFGLTKAANTFDKDKNFSFSTYSYKVIKNEILIEMRKINKSNKHNIKIVSINSEIESTDNSITLEDLIKDKYNLEEDIENKLKFEDLHEAIDTLHPYYKKLINYRLEGKTQREIADILGLSQPQICRLLSQAINYLRDYYKKKGMM